MKHLASFLLLIAATLVTNADVRAAKPLTPKPFTVMSFNVRGDFDGGVATDKPTGWLRKDGAHRRELTLRLVREADPDLLGVQEAYRNQVRELDAALPGHGFVGVGRDDGVEAGEHSAIYYRRDRFERVADGTFWLSETPDEPSTFPGAACPRVATWAVLRDRAAAGRELLVLNTHWDHVSEEARLHAAQLIRERLPTLGGDAPAIVMGDLNQTEETASIRRLVGDSDLLVDAYREVFPGRGPNERTYHDFRGGDEGSRIDYVLHTSELRATDAAIVRTSYTGRYPSDHYPVTATLEWKE
ncbi:Endonuclease/Exonuclease/phosphatase family protein [Botrimarina colliarenosi]|uniref:Endonuclease/Exonuclease/phosphatase family protein n=1 Tax=Botrimarina colliarenosi TaxID=2528001 RepID=A0A5C6ABN3_9BACT|nr:endonuclease/exonuclease/phosphatase family protein [Botrimarina colliarenosi]TWT96810.1 Endonuclease/Exonuclease/phosphatase family protein [Botrimarina colliarenosi]